MGLAASAVRVQAGVMLLGILNGMPKATAIAVVVAAVVVVVVVMYSQKWRQCKRWRTIATIGLRC